MVGRKRHAYVTTDCKPSERFTLKLHGNEWYLSPSIGVFQESILATYFVRGGRGVERSAYGVRTKGGLKNMDFLRTYFMDGP